MDLAYDHVQAITSSMRPLDYYLRLSEALNALSRGEASWASLAAKYEVEDCSGRRYASNGRDLVTQLLVALDMRVVAYGDHGSTTSVVVRSRDAGGATFLVTAAAGGGGGERAGAPYFARRAYVERYLGAHGGRPGFAALAFRCADPGGVAARYEAMHPSLLDRREVVGGRTHVECFYFYDGAAADAGTALRFVEGARGGALPPGLEPVAAAFAETAGAAIFSDHWVANVRDRVGTLRVLRDTLGLVPKVEFDAGVVAAGEAVIESTVAGTAEASSDSSAKKRKVSFAGCLDDDCDALRDATQIFLPINNPLSPVGHVAGHIKELGQGVQHVASRVKDRAGKGCEVGQLQRLISRSFSTRFG